MNVILVKSSHPKSQGDYVRIDAASFNADTHELYTASHDAATLAFADANKIKVDKPKKPTAAEQKKADDDAAKQQEAAAKEAAKNAAGTPTGAGDGAPPPNLDPTAKPAGW